jgi:hypothetical protein
MKSERFPVSPSQNICHAGADLKEYEFVLRRMLSKKCAWNFV